MLRAKRGNRGLRAVAAEIGNVSASTLSRVEHGNIPRLETFMLICQWLAVSPDDFAVIEAASGTKMKMEAKLEVPDAIEAHLRSNIVLPPDTIESLSETIRVSDLGWTQIACS